MFKPIPGFPDYEIDEDGVILNNFTFKILKPTLDRLTQYWQVDLCRNKIKHRRDVHVLVLLTFVGPPNEGEECSHLNGNRQDCRLINLKWESHSANMKRMTAHGTQKYGGRKLLDEEIVLIKGLKGLKPSRVVAANLGIAKTTVLNIWSGKAWKDK